MAGKAKPKPYEVFEANIEDADRLIAFARTLTNGRKYGMRRELRESVGDALKMQKKKWDSLDCVESDDLFVVIKPGGAVVRENFTEPQLRPLLRQAVVATSAAIESYVAEKARVYISEALETRPERFKDVTLSLDVVLDIESQYTRRRWGHRAILEGYIDAEASADPAKIGKIFSTVGVKGFWPKVDGHRHKSKGTSERQLREIRARRNKIAHTGDRTPTGRATLSLDVVEEFAANARSIVGALEAVL